MMLRLGLAFGGCAVATSYWSVKVVHAAGADEESTKQPKKKIRPSELPIYGDPDPVELEGIDEKITTFRKYVSDSRKWTWEYMDSIKETTDKIKDKYEVGKSHTADALAYIQEDSAVLPRAAIITVSGLGGIVAGYKGGVLRKAIYSALAMTAGASVCYPNQAVDIANSGWSVVSEFTSKTYSDTFSSSKGAPEKTQKLENVAKVEITTPKSASKPTQTSSDTVKKDFGMSKPDEKDMYTTRS